MTTLLAWEKVQGTSRLKIGWNVIKGRGRFRNSIHSLAYFSPLRYYTNDLETM